MRLAAEQPGRLLHGKSGWRLPNQPQELMLLFFHAFIAGCLNRADPANFCTQSARTHQYIRILQGAFAGPGGRWRARLGPVKGIQSKFDTRDSNFRVLSAPSDGGLSALFFAQPWGTCPS